MTNLIKILNVSVVIMALSFLTACSSTKGTRTENTDNKVAQAPSDGPYQARQDFIWQRLVNRARP